MIYAKAGLPFKQIQDRLQKGADGIEIQLVNDFDILQHNKEDFRPYLDESLLAWLEQKEKNEAGIQVVHTPLYQQQDYVIELKESEHIILQTVALAQFFAVLQQQDVLVVIHTRENVNHLRSYGRLKEIQAFVTYLLNTYPNVSLAFENLTFFTFSGKMQGMEVHAPISIQENQVVFSNIELVKVFESPRCGTVIDTCHAIMTQTLFDQWKQFYQTPIFDKDVMESLFQQSQPYLRLIHLNNAKEHGHKRFHGLPFKQNEKEEMRMLRNIHKLYQTYGKDCPITIEVREEDYTNAVHFQETLQAWKSI